MQKKSPIQAWVVEDTGFVKKGTHSVGVTRQYWGQVGTPENCRVAVSLSITTATLSLPIAWRLYLPQVWREDKKRRKATGVPQEIGFQTKAEIALDQIRAAVDRGIPPAPVLADTAYGNDTQFREGITELTLPYVLAIQASVRVWPPGPAPLPKRTWIGSGRRPKRLQRDPQHQPVAVRELAMSLPSSAWKTVRWREGTRKPLRSRFAALRVRPAHHDYERSEPRPEEWLLLEWPRQEAEPVQYWLSTLPAVTKLQELVRWAHHRWMVERDYEELQQELGLGHYEGRGWRGFHHHATLCIAAYGFLVAERSRFSPSARAGQLALSVPEMPSPFHPRGSSHTRGAA
jgi:SRSO17 transposase